VTRDDARRARASIERRGTCGWGLIWGIDEKSRTTRGSRMGVVGSSQRHATCSSRGDDKGYSAIRRVRVGR
jgi:hypothetical protein